MTKQRFKTIISIPIILALSYLSFSALEPASVHKINTAVNENWISLFNGKDLNDWKVKITGHELGDNWKNTFIVSDGTIKVDYSGYSGFDNSFGHLFYKNPYSNYRLKLQYRFTGEQIKGGPDWALRNSGVMIHSQTPESMELQQDFPVSIEVQLLGGITEGAQRSTANLCTPGTHVTIDDKLVTNHCINSSSDTYYGDQWVDLEVLVLSDSLISHWINGKKVIQYSKPIIGGEFNTMQHQEGQLLKEGYISLQSESHPVEFKNIRLLNLNQ